MLFSCYLLNLLSHVRFLLGVKSVNVSVNPISCYIEDTYITTLMEYLKVLMPNKLVLWPIQRNKIKVNMPPGSVSKSLIFLSE